jgi:hypothetical protein
MGKPVICCMVRSAGTYFIFYIVLIRSTSIKSSGSIRSCQPHKKNVRIFSPEVLNQDQCSETAGTPAAEPGSVT